MSWTRGYYGRVIDRGLVHVVYTEAKINRVYWTSQCDIQWGHRDNTDPDAYRPTRTKKPTTCLECIAMQAPRGWPW